MMKFNFNFQKMYGPAVVVSAFAIIASIVMFFTKGLNYGVDFRGGAEVQVKFEKTVELGSIRSALDKEDFKSSSVQSIGEPGHNEFLVKVSAEESDLNAVTDKITRMFNADFADSKPEILKTDIVGPKAGEQLRISGFQAMAWALLMIMIYIGLRFEFKYAPGAIMALAHDVIIVVGAYLLTGKEFSLQTVGALLAIIGYSVNDTVVVYDRVREHEVANPSGNLRDLISLALNETFTRTILTAVSTMIVAFVMYIMGGGVIHDFFFAMTLGIIVGCYSSIFVAAPIVLFFDKFAKKKA